MGIVINKKGRKVKLDVRKAGLFGFMFKSSGTENLLFEFKRDVRVSLTSFFVFFKFLVVWLDENDEVLGVRAVKPFEISIRPKFKFRKIVEISINLKNKRVLDFLVGNREKFK